FKKPEIPDTADLYFATLGARGFVRVPDASKRILANVNTNDLEFAPALSADGLELYFTRRTRNWLFDGPRILRAQRASIDEPFGKPVRVEMGNGFADGASVAPDKTLYFHRKVAGRYEVWRTSNESAPGAAAPPSKH